MIYFIDCPPSQMVKIGYASDEIGCWRRMADFQTGNPFRLQMIGTVVGSLKQERASHRALRLARRSGEWFRRKDAMAFMRLARRAGVAKAVEATARWVQNEHKASSWKNALLRKKCILVVRLVIRRIQRDGWTFNDLAELVGASSYTISNAAHGRTMLSFLTVARLAFHFPKQSDLIQKLWERPEPTVEERLDRIERELGALRREVGT